MQQPCSLDQEAEFTRHHLKTGLAAVLNGFHLGIVFLTAQQWTLTVYK